MLIKNICVLLFLILTNDNLNYIIIHFNFGKLFNKYWIYYLFFYILRINRGLYITFSEY